MPHLLTDEQNRQQVKVAKKLLQKFQICDKKQFANAVTGDETCVYYFEHVRKVSKMIWVTKHSKRPIVAKRSLSAREVWYAIFVSSEGVAIKVLLLLTFCLLLLPLWESVIVLFCCTLLYFHSSIAIILMGKRELIALLNLSSWCVVMVERLFLAMPRGCLQFVIVVFPDHTHYFGKEQKTSPESTTKTKYWRSQNNIIRNDALSLVLNISVFYMAMSLLIPTQ